MDHNLPKNYDPKAFEERIYRTWEESGAFKASVNPDRKPFTIVMPPPNITGQLHMGHALDHTLQDVLVRWKRLSGFEALWLPGTDHASIATEVKVANMIRETEGKTKEELGREEFLKRAWKWREEYGGRITTQARKLGDSCDWSRERFTMDEGCSNAVKEQFIRLYNKGLIYKGNRMINWCPSCATSLSDAEVEHEDVNGKYWYFRYPGEDGGEGITVATSRPETMFGDTAIAVNPDDPKHKDKIGKNVILPLVGRVIPIIADPYPDPEKGTGAVKITPAHDPNDFEVGLRHNLEQIVAIDEAAKMTEAAGEYAGMDRYECRKLWVKALDEAGYLVKTENMTIPTGTCYRCHTVIEPRLSEQWFVKMDELAKPALEAIVAKNGKKALNLIPERFEKIYSHWLEEIKDWCISRQLWWGHRIPAYYCEDCGETVVAKEMPAVCPKCGGTHFRQDEDVLDTWFSSALWPFSTMGWPEETAELQYFFPTDVLVTGYDIIFFWVVRMVFSSLDAMGEVPFKDVYIHGLVRDAEGRKMSKSLGNGIDPLEVIDKYGADALRFMLATGIAPGSDMRFKTERLENCRNFANKLWNASRFVLMNLADENGSWLPIAPDSAALLDLDLRDEDKWILSRINETANDATYNMEQYDLALAGQKIYDLIWGSFCDWYIELVKQRLYDGTDAEKAVVRRVLVKCLEKLLTLLHPFMPFITEEIWSHLPDRSHMLIHGEWPVFCTEWTFPEEVARMELAMSIIRSVRNIRSEAEAAPAKKLRLLVLANDPEAVKAETNHLEKLGMITAVEFLASKADVPDEVMSAVVDGAEIYVPLDDLLDYNQEYDRVSKEVARLEGEVKRIGGMLSNQAFVSKAPEKVVNNEREKLATAEEMLAKNRERLAVVAKKLGK